jgi:hypothetical protein
MGEAMTVMARKAPERRWAMRAVGVQTYALRSPAPRHLEKPVM